MTIHKKVNQMNKGINVRPETTKLEENIGGKLLNVDLSKDFFFWISHLKLRQ